METKKKVSKVEKVEELDTAGEKVVSEEVVENEGKTLFWFFVVVAVVFGSFLVPYFWVETSKSFEFGGIDWVVEEYEYLEIFHGRFVSLTNPNLNYNVFFRTDPRTNDAEVSGSISEFKYGGIISLSPEMDACRGDLSRVMLDLGAFLKQGVGVGELTSGTNNEDVANESGRMLVTCENTDDRTVVIVDISDEERGIVQDEMNPYCYTIYAQDCEDSAAAEKFMVQAIVDFRKKYVAED